MAATLAQIDAALFTALQALESGPPTDTQPFALVGRYAGRWTREGVVAQCAAQYPAALLRQDREEGRRTVDGVGYNSQDVGTARWTVLVVLQEPRAVDDAVQGATGVPGMLTLQGAVTGALNALVVTGLWHGGRTVRYVRAADYEPLIHLGVAYAREVVFEAQRVVEDAADPVESTQDLLGIDGDVNLTPDSGDSYSPNPFGEFNADTDP